MIAGGGLDRSPITGRVQHTGCHTAAAKNRNEVRFEGAARRGRRIGLRRTHCLRALAGHDDGVSLDLVPGVAFVKDPVDPVDRREADCLPLSSAHASAKAAMLHVPVGPTGRGAAVGGCLAGAEATWDLKVSKTSLASPACVAMRPMVSLASSRILRKSDRANRKPSQDPFCG